MGRARSYTNTAPLPTVGGMMTAGGAGYDGRVVQHASDVEVMRPLFPTSWLGRIQTPIVGRLAFTVAVNVGGSWDPREGPSACRCGRGCPRGQCPQCRAHV